MHLVYITEPLTVFLLLLTASHVSTAQLVTQQVKGIVGNRHFPVEIPNLQPDTEINWRYGPVEPDSTIVEIQNGKIDVFEERFKARLQLDNMSSSLRINGLEREDSGIYQVEEFKGNRYKKRFNLSVYMKEDTRFLLPLPASGQPRSAAQLATQQVKGIVGESFTFPVEIPNLQPDTEINWRYGPVELDSTIARIQNGKIEVFEKRFKARLQLDNMSSSLRINGLEREDSGFYQVETIRGNGFIKIFQLSVYSECHTLCQSLKSTGVWLANRSCTLLCFVGSASEVNVFWIRDGKPLNTTELEISQEMQGDNVTYTCVASNPASNKSITVTPSDYCV
ncbi:hypothetical protein AOXY_G38529, partial [Acipenser oxyrinchus oxyrinchus]